MPYGASHIADGDLGRDRHAVAMVARPLARLRRALDESAKADFALRISHRRGDEFGAAFDAFNRAAAAIEPRLAGEDEGEAAMLATRIAGPTKLAA